MGRLIRIGHGQDFRVRILLHPFPFQETLSWLRRIEFEIGISAIGEHGILRAFGI
jgi:hypothetical protein